ncbi:unnamed protein product [Schistosoma spindalis]|nr:unnamed protein product [Schistosoma spindale]
MLNEMNSGGLHCVADSDNALKLKISFSGGKCPQECSEPDVLTEVTSRNLYTVLSEIHQNLVRRDPRGIFANPVTDDIAVGYSEVISKPMDLGTIYNRLKSRAYYQSATEYLADVTLMCNNAMVYNPPDTIYYQRARKLLAFCRKQMTVSSLQKACKDMPGGLTLEEIGDLTSVEAQMNQMNRVNPFHRSSKLHTYSQNELIDHKFCFSPKHHDDSNRNISPNVQPLVSHSFQKHRGRPKSHLSTSSRLYHINRKVLKSYSHFSSEEHLSRDDLKKKNDNNNTENCISTVEFKKSLTSVTSSKKVQLTHQDTSIRSSVNTPILSIPHRRGRGRPRKIKIDDIQTSSGSSTLNISTQLQDSSLISSNSIPIDGKKHSENLSTLSHDHYSRSMCVNNSFENSITGHSNLSLGSIQSEHENPLTESVMKNESNSQYTQEFLNNEPIVLLNIAPSTPSSSPLSGSSCRTFIGKTSLVSKKSQKLPSDIQSNKSSQFKIDRNKEMFNYPDKTSSINDEDSVYNDSCDESVERSYHHIVDNVPNEILVQAKKAAEESAAKLKRKYECIASIESNNEYIGPKIVCLNCSNQGEISAVECPKARSSINQQHPNPSDYNNHNISENGESLKPRPNYNVSYPPFLIDLLTKSKLLNTQKVNDHSLSKQNKILDDLNKLKYNIDEPIAGAIHGPLAIFSAAQLTQLSDVYGGDPSGIEYAISLLKFVQPMGRWARRWAAKRLDAATDGLHSQAYYTLSSQPAHTVKPTVDKDKSDLLQNWTDVVDITIDPPTPKVDQSDVEQLEPCLVDLLNQYDTVISCNNHTNSSVLSTSNESVPSVPDTNIPYVKKDNLNSINTSSLSGSLDIPVSINSCSVSFCNNDMSNSQLVSDSTLNVANVPQQNSSTGGVDNEIDDVIICESVPSPIAIHTPNGDAILPQYDTQQSEQLPLIATKLPEDEIIITDECTSSSVKSTDYVVPSNTLSLNEHELDSVDHINSVQTSEISTDSSTSLLKTALSGSSFSLNTSHDRINVQSKGTVDVLEDSFGNLSSSADCSTIISTHSLFLDSHLITHKELPVNVSHLENQIVVSHCNPISRCSETTDSLTDPVVQNSYGEINADNHGDTNANSAILNTVESSHSLILSNSMLLDNTCETNEQLISNSDISSVS